MRRPASGRESGQARGIKKDGGQAREQPESFTRDTWELVAREFLQTPCEIKAFLTLAEPKQGRTIGHIAAEEKDEALWAILLDIGDGYPGEFFRLLSSRDDCNKTVEQRIRACGAPRLSEMLDEYLGENNKNTK